MIEAKHIDIGPDCVIGENVTIKCKGTFKLGRCSIIKDGCTITCNNFEAGEYLYMSKNVEIGRGGNQNPDSNVKIGDHVGIFENAIINPNSAVTIGNDVGIGAEVMIWTHGAWLDVLQGFPSDFGPVTIGNNVWLPARSIVLPNVEIGDNVVIGTGSLVNKSIPSGSLAAGSPCRVIREDYYPQELSEGDKTQIVFDILGDWCKLHEVKGIEADVNYTLGSIVLKQTFGFDKTGTTIFNLVGRTIEGFENDVSEDLRDYLRRRGIKIFTGKPFKSI